TRVQIAGRQSADAEAKSEDRREESRVGERKAKTLADVGCQYWEQVAVRSHQSVGDQQHAIHRDGDALRVRGAFRRLRTVDYGLVRDCPIPRRRVRRSSQRLTLRLLQIQELGNDSATATA